MAWVCLPVLKILFIYCPSLSYVRGEAFFSSDVFRESNLSSDEYRGLADNIVYLYDPLDIVVEHYSSSDLDVFDLASLQGYADFVLSRLDQLERGCHAVSIWRLALFYRLHGHLDILETSSGSDNIVQSCKVRQSAPIFRYLAQLLVRENPLLFDQYFNLESRSLLLSTQVDLGWAERPHAKAFTAFELIQKVRFWSLALNEAHEDLDLHYSFNESRSMLLDGYSDALRKMIRLVVER